MRRPCFRDSWVLFQDGGTMIWRHHVLTRFGRDCLAALEACFTRGERDGSPFRNLLLLCRNLPRLPSGAVNGGVNNRSAHAWSVPQLGDLCLLQHHELWRVWVRIYLYVFLFQRKKQIQTRNKSRITLVRCDRVCNWMDVIEKILWWKWFWNRNADVCLDLDWFAFVCFVWKRMYACTHPPVDSDEGSL